MRELYTITPPADMDGPDLTYFKMQPPDEGEDPRARAIRESAVKKRYIRIEFRGDGRTLLFEDSRDVARFLRMKNATLRTYLARGPLTRTVYNSLSGNDDIATISYEVRRDRTV